MTITISLIDADQALAARPALCRVLVDCVEDGASLGFMSPYGLAEAAQFWDGTTSAVADGGTLLITAAVDGIVVGTVQVGIRQMPNQQHRGDLKKLLVSPSARGLGLGRQLMEAAERAAAARGKTLLVLDTATGSPAEAIYPRLGWTRVGVIPDYALFPDGRFCDTTLFYKRIG